MIAEYRIGIDGGGTKTHGILIDSQGSIVYSHVSAGCNPVVIGAAAAHAVIRATLEALLQAAQSHAGGQARILATLLCMAGDRLLWRAFANSVRGFGHVSALDDSHPVLELATGGGPGLVLHAGTGSFVAVRDFGGRVHYAGGLGWRFGDPGSGYDLGRRAVAWALLDLQGWRTPGDVTRLVQAHTGISALLEMERYFAAASAPNSEIAALAPGILRLAADGAADALDIVERSARELAELAVAVIGKLFSPGERASIRIGLSGPILNHPVVVAVMCDRCRMPIFTVNAEPVEGVRRMLMRFQP